MPSPQNDNQYLAFFCVSVQSSLAGACVLRPVSCGHFLFIVDH